MGRGVSFVGLLLVAVALSGCLLMRDPDAIDLAEVGYPLTLAFEADPQTPATVEYVVAFSSATPGTRPLAQGQVTLSDDGRGEAAEALPPGELVMDITLRGVGACSVPLSVFDPGVTDLGDLPPLTFDTTITVGPNGVSCTSTKRQ